MIKSFSCKDTKLLFEGGFSRKFQAIKQVAERKLQMLDSAVTLEFLRSPPSNRLEILGGNRSGQYSIRINKQWRLCFIWKNSNVYNVEIIDYH